MADIADIWIYIIDKVFRGRLIRMGTRKNAIAIKQEPTVLFIFNLFIIILYEYVCSLIRLVHRYLSGSSIRMLLQIDTIEFKKMSVHPAIQYSYAAVSTHHKSLYTRKVTSIWL